MLPSRPLASITVMFVAVLMFGRLIEPLSTLNVTVTVSPSVSATARSVIVLTVSSFVV